ncbi:hypothetical protein HQ602_08180 [Rhodococcus kroppenstedtii]|uniref:hypothetical protein n=1 Tax=Rhodococcoides kroppenstedtii TaxID=293050 RepID=UPI001C9B827D|nr:hypothetical protein [Rhodococcus kroppenstedtii]MBY6436357.1 hypothetical protein [Rhodococcus kroppenstedtii]
MNRRRRLAALVLGAATVLTVWTVPVEATDAAWFGRDHLSANVTAGSWPTSGSAAAQAGTVTLLQENVSVLGSGPPRPWVGPSAERSQVVPGAQLSTSAGPYRAIAVAGLANGVTSGSTTGGAIGGSSCAVYPWGPSQSTECSTPQPSTAFGSATLSNYLLRADLLSILGLGRIDAAIVQDPIRTSVTCTPGSSTSFDAPSLVGSRPLLVRSTPVAMPAANASTPISVPAGSVGVSVTGSLTSTVQSGPTSARSTLTLSVRLVRLGLVGLPVLDLQATVVLVEAVCGTGPMALTTANEAGSSAARVAAPPAEADGVVEPETTTSAAPTTTSAAPTTTSAAPTTTSAAPTTTSAAPTTTSAAATTSNAAPTTTTTVPRTTTAPPTTTTAPATTFTGSAEDTVTRLNTADGAVCTASDDGGLSCDDGTTLPAEAVTPSAVAAATVQGVWTPRTTDGAPVRVVSAVRG